jgi:hypothetical protein
MISLINKSVIDKLQFCWISGNANLNFNMGIIAVLRLAPMTSWYFKKYIAVLQFNYPISYFAQIKMFFGGSFF